MADFHIWGRIIELGSHDFYVIVSEVPDEFPANSHGKTAVVTRLAESRDAAVQIRGELMREAGATIVARGDRVVDVIDDQEVAPPIARSLLAW
jgi:hypothetical protein